MGEKPDYKAVIKEKLKEVDIADGVSKEEAIILAQNYLLSENLDKILIVSKPHVKNYPFKENFWHVSFPTTFELKLRGLKWGSALVDKKIGKVEYIGEGPS